MNKDMKNKLLVDVSKAQMEDYLKREGEILVGLRVLMSSAREVKGEIFNKPRESVEYLTEFNVDIGKLLEEYNEICMKEIALLNNLCKFLE